MRDPLLFWLLITVVGLVGAFLTALISFCAVQYRHRVHSSVHMRTEMTRHKKEIMHYAFLHDGVVSNNITEALCRVSDATATRYLQALEDEQKLRQIGKTGRSVFYESY